MTRQQMAPAAYRQARKRTTDHSLSKKKVGHHPTRCTPAGKNIIYNGNIRTKHSCPSHQEPVEDTSVVLNIGTASVARGHGTR